ncbi:MAG: flavin-dependent monooxygenase [Deltaproteobacteria bacterium]|jgi:3-hydroxy-9,10-secoandrosta-1,3,5(10)-triene-9,17-dione monooxygenase|nr:flavin-dependent monooxygenase [Deltaproteobacteria bacterium]
MKLEDVAPTARALVPAAAERAEKTEEARRLLPEGERDLRDAGLFKIVQPKRFGGFELDPVSIVRATSEVARGCGSTGWCLGILAIHNWMLGLYDERAQEDVWGEDPGTLLAASFAPTGSAERVEGGIRVSGRWSFASGCDASRWMMVGAVVPSEGPIPDLRMFLVPQSEYRIDDNWHVSGLAGTGSKDIVIDGAVVPEYRAISLIDAFNGRSPGQQLYSDSPLFRVPFGTMLLFALAGPALGLARGAYEAFIERAKVRQITYSAEKVSEQAPVHVLLGEASYMMDAVDLLWERDLAEIAQQTREKHEFTMEERARHKRDVGLGLRSCHEVTVKLAAASGAHGIFKSSPIQRAVRDAQAMTTHAALDPLMGARTMGRVALGLDPATMLV